MIRQEENFIVDIKNTFTLPETTAEIPDIPTTY
jgi:hypothetical protein